MQNQSIILPRQNSNISISTVHSGEDYEVINSDYITRLLDSLDHPPDEENYYKLIDANLFDSIEKIKKKYTIKKKEYEQNEPLSPYDLYNYNKLPEIFDTLTNPEIKKKYDFELKTKYPDIQDRTNSDYWHIITIDPPKSLDYDDGFSIVDIGDGIQQLSIYISNVTIWMDTLNLWESFSKRISTIYLPDKKRPMLPTILSDCLCSLQENVTRVAFVVDVFIKDNMILNMQFSNCLIKVYKNYCYEEPKLLADPKYHIILDAVRELSIKNSYIDKVRNSHDVVCYLMIFMNYHCAKELIQFKTGVFRSTIIKKEINIPVHIPEETAKFIKIWNSGSGQYMDGSEIINTRHELLDMDAYIHITSPIRRLVDLLNMIKFQQVKKVAKLSENSNLFYEKWLNDLEFINLTMRSIRKVQCDCTLLDLCSNNPEILEKEYDGYLFDKICRNDGLFQFIVFLPELKLTSRITCRENCENFECKKFTLFLFHNEEKFKKKIRLHLHL